MFARIDFSANQVDKLYAQLQKNIRDPEYKAKLILAAKSGEPKAQYLLGICYKNGFGVEKNLATAKDLYKLSSDQKFAPAQFKLAVYLQNKTPPEYKTAYHLLTSSSNQGFTCASHALAYMYIEGKGVKANFHRAFHHTLIAAKDGIPVSQYNLARMLENGDGVKKNIAEAARWYRLAAEQAYPAARKNLITIYSKLPQTHAITFFGDSKADEKVAIIYHTALAGFTNALVKVNHLAIHNSKQLIHLLEKYPEDCDKLLPNLNSDALDKINPFMINRNTLLVALYSLTTIDMETLKLMVEYCMGRNSFICTNSAETTLSLRK